ncbi:hypothetical protein [Gluconobacter sp.]|uniref:hypothetical protein n=1 Tax=Gluconobacter sp. TaxID=1876758 RepID=UPI0039E7DD33
MERMFNRLKQIRRIATHYDKTTLSFMSFLNIAAARVKMKLAAMWIADINV